jgi:competence protein ComEC
MRVTFIDVGEGDSVLVEAPCGRGGSPVRILIDGGGAPGRQSGGTNYDTGEMIVAPELHKRGITGLDMVVLSHPDADHLNGLLYVLKNFHVGRVIESGADPHTAEYAEFKRIMRSRGIENVTGGEGFAAGARGCLSLEFLHPPRELLGLGERSMNDVSQVFMLRYGDKSALFPGDLQETGEDTLLMKYAGSIGCGVLKAPHHGSSYSASEEFIRAAHPAIVAISVGRRNVYGHPGKAALERYAAAGAKIYRTDTGGSIEMTFPPRGGTIKVRMKFNQ